MSSFDAPRQELFAITSVNRWWEVRCFKRCSDALTMWLFQDTANNAQLQFPIKDGRTDTISKIILNGESRAWNQRTKNLVKIIEIAKFKWSWMSNRRWYNARSRSMPNIVRWGKLVALYRTIIQDVVEVVFNNYQCLTSFVKWSGALLSREGAVAYTNRWML